MTIPMEMSLSLSAEGFVSGSKRSSQDSTSHSLTTSSPDRRTSSSSSTRVRSTTAPRDSHRSSSANVSPTSSRIGHPHHHHHHHHHVASGSLPPSPGTIRPRESFSIPDSMELGPGSSSHRSSVTSLDLTSTNATPTQPTYHQIPASLPISIPGSRNQSRRASPLFQHELQPPTRRLSAHQVLLLTPFGGGRTSIDASNPLPGFAGTGVTNAMGMSRTPSSMGMSSSQRNSISGGSIGLAASTGGMRRELTPNQLLREPTNMFIPNPRRRARHSSLAHTSVSSPLAAAPLTTIPSASDESSGDSAAPSREPSNQGIQQYQHEEVGPVTVPMMRSNSLPVLTLRELQAMRDKDGELGINRGGHWAWVSRENNEIGDDFTDSSGPSYTASTSSTSSSAITPPAVPWQFSDPFASATTTQQQQDTPRAHRSIGGGIGGIGGHHDQGIDPSYTHTHFHPVATAEGYHYSPHQEERRLSDAPSAFSSTASTASNPSPKAHARRPSAPIAHRGLQPIAAGVMVGTGATSIALTSAARAVAAIGIPAEPIPQNSRRAQFIDSQCIENTGVVQRPKLMRYKTSPARHTGLGLEIHVRSDGNESGPSTRGSIAPGSGRSARRQPPISGGSSGNNTPGRASRGGGGRSPQPPISTQSRGSWAPIDLLDALEAELEIEAHLHSRGSISGSISSLSSGRNSIALSATTATAAGGGGNGPRSTGSISPNIVVFDRANIAATNLSEFGRLPAVSSAREGAGVGGGARNRYDSVDSVFPPKRSYRDIFDMVPRRTSLAVIDITNVDVGPESTGGGEEEQGRDEPPFQHRRRTESEKVGTSSAGRRDSLQPPAPGGWMDRRGSWGEGWARNA